MEKTEPGDRRLVIEDRHVWPFIIGVALAVVIAVNLAFIFLAVNGADDVAPSYVSGQR